MVKNNIIKNIENEFEQSVYLAKSCFDEIKSVVYGQNEVIGNILTAVFAGGNSMLVGVPGLAKSLLVETIGAVCGLETKRIQFTPDLMPADITGSEILDKSAKNSTESPFRFIKGPVFTNLLMADEINRANPRTQSALLQAMQERKVTAGGITYDLPKPFMVIATRNPIEQYGTYPLPEAQADRFMFEIEVGYPSMGDEKQIILKTTTEEPKNPSKIISLEQVIDIQNIVRNMPIGDNLTNRILNLVRSLRPETSDIEIVKRYVEWGAGIRAGQAFIQGVRARAMIIGRTTPILDDVIAIAHCVLKHRINLKHTARAEGITINHVIEKAIETL